MATSAIQLDSRRFHYVDDGAGDDAIVFVHAFPLSSTMWEPQLASLRDDYRVVACDLAGCGSSDPPDDPAAHSVEAWADDLIALIESLVLERVTIVGASIGADVALAVTRRNRELVGGLALTGLRTHETLAGEEMGWDREIEWIAGGGEVDAIVERVLADLVADESPNRGEVVKQARWMIEQVPQEGWVAGQAVLASRPDPLADADKLDVPVLVLVGEHDRFTPPADAQAFVDRVPGAGLVELADAGHLANMESPGLFTRAIEDLVARREARRPSSKHTWPAAPATTRTGSGQGAKR